MCATTAGLTAQTPNYSLQLHCTTDTVLLQKVFKKTLLTYADSTAWANAPRQIMTQLQQQGYWSAAIDSTTQQGLHRTELWLWIGQSYRIAQLQTHRIGRRWLTHLPRRYLHPSTWQQAQQLQQKLLTYAENNGYPFAQTRLDSLLIAPDGSISAQLLLDEKQYFTYDTLSLLGDVRIAKPFLYRYLGIKPQSPYNEHTLLQVQKRLNELPFLQQEKTPTVNFVVDKARLSLWLKRKKASRFDVMLGIIPRTETNSTLTTRQRYEITGEGNLYLQNALGGGETIDVAFRSYRQQSRQLKAHFTYPYLPTLPFGSDVAFELFIRDTTHRDVMGTLSLQYPLQGNNYFKVFWHTKSSTILSLDSLRIAATRRLPALLDYSTQQYGIACQYEHLDYRFNPRRGQALNVYTSVGVRRVQPNNRLLGIGEAIGANFAEQYDSLRQKPLQAQLQYKLSRYTPLGRHSTLKTELQGAITAADLLLANEVYRIGGNKLLRGFDEQSIFATQYHLLTTEYRLLVDNSATTFFVFADAVYTQNRTNRQNTERYYMGTGIGTTLGTKAGVFALSYAIGKQEAAPFDLRAAKVHFGYINYF